MKLASLKNGSLDGSLVVVDRNLKRFVRVPEISPTLQGALDHWDDAEAHLEYTYQRLSQGEIVGLPLDVSTLAAPLPRAYQWLDGSAYLSHVQRVRKARGAEMPPSFLHDPLMYQGASDSLLACRDPIEAADESWGIDLEAELAAITDAVPRGATVEDAAEHIRLLALVNDVSLRNLIPDELAKGFGFLHGKPPTAFSPVMASPSELGEAWRGCRAHLPLSSYVNDELIGQPDAGLDMQFNFAELIVHAAKTRPLGAGTIIGSGTVSNHNLKHGFSCLAEKRVVEMVEQGEAKTAFLNFGDRVRIEMLNEQGESIFGSIEQEVVKCPR